MTYRMIGLASVVAVLSQTAFAQDSAGWTESCDAKSCTLSRGVSEEATGKPVMTLLVAVQKAEAGARFGMALPLGVAVAPGVRVLYGGETADIPFEVCFPDGCRALLALDAAALGRLTAQAEIDVRFFPFNAATPVSLTVPIGGLDSAIVAAAAKLQASP